MKTNTQTQHAQHDLWSKILDVERIDGRGRKIDPSVQVWIEQIAITDNVIADPIPMFNWLAGVSVRRTHDGWLEIIPPHIGTFGPKRYAEWLERWLWPALKAYGCHHARIAGLAAYQFPPQPPEKDRYSEDELVAMAAQVRTDAKMTPPIPTAPGTVPWAYMEFPQCQQNGLIGQILSHVAGLKPPKRRVDYIRFLCRQRGFPRDLFGQHGIEATEGAA